MWAVGNINLPAPLAYAGGALCLLGGYLIGVVAGPQTADQSIAIVESYDAGDDELCLSGDSVADDEGAEDGVLCGQWRKVSGVEDPKEGDTFRFVSLQRVNEGEKAVYIYGEVDDSD